MAPVARRWRLGVLALTAALAAVCAATGGAVVGGAAIRVQAAPWTVFIEQQSGSSRFLCTGTILDATHVLTAAHCLFGEDGVRATPDSLSVEAGVSNSASPLGSDQEQQRLVTTIRVHPGYVWSAISSSDDVAVLTLADPLTLGGPTARAVSLPLPGSPFPDDALVGMAAFGREQPTTLPDGSLNWLVGRVDPQGACGLLGDTGVIPDNGITLCASSRASATCNGDSGGGLVTTGASPVLVGVLSGGPVSCEPGGHSLYTYTGAPEIRSFILGDNSPPRAPRETARTYVNLTWEAPLVVGTRLTCASGGWIGAPRLAYAFQTSGGGVLSTGGAPSLVLDAHDRGRSVYCEVTATNAGGTTLDLTNATTPVGPIPSLRLLPLPAVHALPGGLVRVRVAFRAPLGLNGTFAACLTPPGRIGHRICASLTDQHGGAGVFAFELGFRVSPAAPAGAARLAVEVVAGAASAHGTVGLRVTRSR